MALREFSGGLAPSALQAPRRHVAVLYAFARIADDFADEPEYEGRRIGSACWIGAPSSRTPGEGSRAPSRVPGLGRDPQGVGAPKEPFADLLDAFLQDVRKSRYATFDEVLDYCRRSANPVGRIVLMIHGYRDPELFRYSDAICTALQLANFWQDLSVDLKKGRIYIPEEDFKQFGYSEADLRMGVVNERSSDRLMKFQVEAHARPLR